PLSRLQSICGSHVTRMPQACCENQVEVGEVFHYHRDIVFNETVKTAYTRGGNDETNSTAGQ
ncbi:hypothetical protein, partial [Peribacillus simplex]|uniref:hypothetical protein n=1 Tax=Peribacillus simplex TaxID=1478 RepID=UPI001C87FDF8